MGKNLLFLLYFHNVDAARAKPWPIINKVRKYFNFLMGWNESYSNIRGQILLQNSLSNLNRTYFKRSVPNSCEEEKKLGVYPVSSKNPRIGK